MKNTFNLFLKTSLVFTIIVSMVASSASALTWDGASSSGSSGSGIKNPQKATKLKAI